jgi:hypothetical protein
VSFPQLCPALRGKAGVRGILYFCSEHQSMARIVILFLLSSFCLSASGQNIKPSDVPGKWVLTRHLITVNGKRVNKMDPKRVSSYSFSNDGTYRLSEGELGNNKIYITKGKWKVTANGKKIQLYNNVDVPHESGVQTGDMDLLIEYLDGEYYLTYTYGDTTFPPNTDCWKKGGVA